MFAEKIIKININMNYALKDSIEDKKDINNDAFVKVRLLIIINNLI